MRAHVKKNDMVVVIAGNHRGSRGKVLAVDFKEEQVRVEGVHVIKKAVRKSQDHPQGGFVQKEGPIHLSNVMPAEEYDRRHKARGGKGGAA
ncbi:MAG: 50S ribosomal protein L24 [Verrucomicrobiae bacterium]|nr:50S ribosomal protein L24 [Verrucomicrobiae bacterium]